MALQITSDVEAWTKVAYPHNEAGELIEPAEVKPDAYAYVVIGSMVIGMGALTEGTADEWLLRLRAYEIIDGPMLRSQDPETGKLTPVPVTMDALRPYFGTTVNVPTMTRAKFRTKMGDIVVDRARDMAWREQREAAATAQ